MIPYVKNAMGRSKEEPLTFKALQDNSSVKLTQTGTPYTIELYYKTSAMSLWAPYTINTEIPLSEGQYVRFWNKGSLFSKNLSNYYQFVMQGSIAAAGNIQSLLSFSKQAPGYCFNYLFQNCTALTVAPKLLANTVGNYSYRYMFYGCTALAAAPDLPATSIGAFCYFGMFRGCTALTSIPSILPATTLKTQCYCQMFKGCSLLTTAPQLPATMMTYGCYYEMFSGCSSLASCPQLPATVLADSCYLAMFGNCTSITKAPELPATTLVQKCYWSMFTGCSALTKAPDLPATVLVPYCYYYMFNGCTHLTHVSVSFTEWNSSNNSTTNWLINVAASGTLIKPAALPAETGVSNIPSGWSVINKLQYIESTGTQYIDTGVKPDFVGGDAISFRLMVATVPNTTYYVALGSRNSSIRNGFIFDVDGRSVPYLRYICHDNSGFIMGGFNNIPFVFNDILTIDVNDSKVSLMGPSYQTSQTMPKRVTSEYPVFLFCFNQGGTVRDYYPGMRLYDWKYYHNGTLAQHLIPVLDSNNVPCMYDTVSGSLYYNAGTGTFNYA